MNITPYFISIILILIIIEACKSAFKKSNTMKNQKTVYEVAVEAKNIMHNWYAKYLDHGGDSDVIYEDYLKLATEDVNKLISESGYSEDEVNETIAEL